MKSIQYDTNFNNKLSNNCFLHITFAPVNTLPEHILQEPILITVIDQPEIQVSVMTLDICRIKLQDLRSIHTLPSHGVLCHEFLEWWQLKYPTSTPETAMAIYYHRKIDLEKK